MAETCTVAFGRYVKRLRERRGLSLDDLHTRSQSFPETLMKGYMSRVENGRQKLAFAKMIPLSRILEVPPDVLVERMELDLELDKVGGPETEGLSYAELFAGMKAAMDAGDRWAAYGYSRDALVRAPVDPPLRQYESQDDQYNSAVMNNASCAIGLARNRFALNELEFVASMPGKTAKDQILIERLCSCYFRLNQVDRAMPLLDRAIAEQRDDGPTPALGYLLSTKALFCNHLERHDEAVELFSEVYKCFPEDTHRTEAARARINLAGTFFFLRRFRAARQALASFQKILEGDREHRLVALSHILYGDLDAAEGSGSKAEEHWKTAADLARKIGDEESRFRAEFRVFKLAHEEKRDRTMRVGLKKLTRLAAKVPSELAELAEFRALSRD